MFPVPVPDRVCNKTGQYISCCKSRYMMKIIQCNIQINIYGCLKWSPNQLMGSPVPDKGVNSILYNVHLLVALWITDFYNGSSPHILICRIVNLVNAQLSSIDLRRCNQFQRVQLNKMSSFGQHAACYSDSCEFCVCVCVLAWAELSASSICSPQMVLIFSRQTPLYCILLCHCCSVCPCFYSCILF